MCKATYATGSGALSYFVFYDFRSARGDKTFLQQNLFARLGGESVEVRQAGMKHEIDWQAVEVAMRRSVRGETLSQADTEMWALAFRAEPKKYAALSKRVRQEEQDAYRRSFSG